MADVATAVRISHVAALVADVEATIDLLGELLGWGPWSIYQLVPPRLTHRRYRGAEGHFGMIGAEAHVGTIDFALNQSLTGPSVYTDHLAHRSYGLHHIACMDGTAGLAALTSRFDAAGVGVQMAGSIDGSIDFVYFDSEDMLGFLVESGTGHAISLEPDATLACTPEPKASAALTALAIVVHDVDKTIRSFATLFGWNAWNVQTEMLEQASENDAATAVMLRTARTRVDPIAVELVQPLTGSSIESDSLVNAGQSLHHLVCRLSPERLRIARSVLARRRIRTTEVTRQGEVIAVYAHAVPRLKLVPDLAVTADA